MSSLWYKSVFAERKDSDKVLIIDFDGTIATDKYPDIGRPLPGVKEAMQRLKDAGFEIVIYTCRLTKNDGRPDAEIAEQKKKIAGWLEENGVKYDRIEDGRDGKPHAKFYVDNKALHYGGDDDWDSISKYIISRG